MLKNICIFLIIFPLAQNIAPPLIITQPKVISQDEINTNINVASCPTFAPKPELNDQDKLKQNYDRGDPKFFDSVVEKPTKEQSRAPNKKVFSGATTPKSLPLELKTTDFANSKSSYNEIKNLLAKVLEQIEEIERRSDGRDGEVNYGKSDETRNNPTTNSNVVASATNKLKKAKKENDPKQQQSEQKGKTKWGHWTDWSSCSVSCGKGRQIRWRHCIDNCQEAETEMEEKTCQLPACGPGKLFGVIKI